jgi:hypothetical protein
MNTPMLLFQRLSWPMTRAHGVMLAAMLPLMPLAATHAQVTSAAVTSPAVTTKSVDASTRPVSAAEAAHHVWIKDGRLKDANAFVHTADYSSDSMKKVMSETGREWLTRMQQSPVKGIQLDPSGHVGVAAEREAYAKQQLAERLATPGLSLQDRAFAYLTAVQAFGDMDYPDRFPQAEAYLKQLDAMGDSAALWRYGARAHLVYMYYLLGRSADVIRHGTSAIALGAVMPFSDRGALNGRVYPATVEALAGQPDGPAKIAALNTTLLAALAASPAHIAYDSNYANMAVDYASNAKAMIMVSAMLGTKARPVVAQLWINRPKSDSATIAVDDGKIRIIEVSDYGCKACMECLDRMERLHRAFPTIDVMFVTHSTGYWKNRLLEPEEEGKALTDFFVNYRKLTFQIGVWLSKKALNPVGGMTPESKGPNELAYPHIARPTFWVIDEKGTIRRIIEGSSDDLEAQLARTVTFLQREAQSAAASTSLSTTASLAATTAR